MWYTVFMIIALLVTIGLCLIAGLILTAYIWRTQVVTRWQLRPFKQALKSGRCDAGERMTFQALVDQCNSSRRFLYGSVILTCFTGWGVLAILIWLMQNSSWKSAWRIDCGHTPVEYVRTFGPQVKEALSSYDSAPRKNEVGKYTAAEKARIHQEARDAHAAYAEEVKRRLDPVESELQQMILNFNNGSTATPPQEPESL